MRLLCLAAMGLVLNAHAVRATPRASPSGHGPGAILAAASPARPGSAHAFDLDHWLTLRSIGEPVWSPDGRRIALSVSAPDTAEDSNNPDLWLIDLERGESLQLTRNPKADTSPTFSPSGDTLAFISTRGTGDDVRSAIWMMSLRGGEPWAFGSFDESVTEVAWSPDGRWLAYVKLDTLPRQIRDWKKKKWDQTIEDERLQFPALWIMPAAGGKARRVTSGEQYVWYVRWAPDSRRVAYLVSPTGKPDDQLLTDIGVADAAQGEGHKLGVVGGAFTWSPDSRWIAWAGNATRESHIAKTDLRVIPAGGGAPVNLTADFDEDAATPSWSAGSDTLFFWSDQGVTARLAAVPRAGGAVRLGLTADGVPGTAFAAPAARGAAAARVAWVESTPTQPNELRVAERIGAHGRPVTSFNAASAACTFGATRTVRWRSGDGTPVEGLLVRPPGAPEKSALKTLVLLHGGPYSDRFAHSFVPTAQYFANAGYQVFLPNFRSSGGYGTAFMMRKRADWGFGDWADVSSGVDTLVAMGLADGAKLGVFGHSYGAYLSAWAITHTDRFRAASVSAGAVDLAAHYGQSDIQRYRAFDFEGPPWVSPENWKRSSPMTYIQNARTPTLITVGDADQRVPYPQSQELYRALTALKVPTEFVHYPREGHGMREPRHRADELTRMRAWFDRWIR
ncbi:MAG TPA: S9 family peptidase [Candidatus Saccharimonadaceae bacterium]|jgi:dipeptidyl aminopeptidase/acylaminoacyl peptidase|nr:S9 family peptidase [Candidatus Saccharimonadaceae bacterium]